MKIEIHRIFFGSGILFFILGLFRYLAFGEQMALMICLFLSFLFCITSAVYFWLEKRLSLALVLIHFWLSIPSAVFFLMCYFETTSMFIPSRFFVQADSPYPNFTGEHSALNLSITVSSIVFGLSYLIFIFNILKTFFRQKKSFTRN